MSNDKIKEFSEEMDKEYLSRNKRNKLKRKMTTAFALIGVVLVATICSIVGKQSKKTQPSSEKDSYSISSTDLSNLGKELNSKGNNETKKDKNNRYIKGNNGKFYVDEESAKNANKVGTSTIDTQNGKLTVDANGKVKDKEIGYEVKDEKGNVVDKGNNGGIPDGYAWDSVLGKYVKESEVGKYVYSDATYYDEDGNIALSKGDIVSKETLANAKKYLLTTKPTKQEPQKETQTPTPSTSTNNNSTSNTNQGVVNADGTYTIGGMTYLSKADYQQCILQGYEGYAMINGVIQPEENVKQYQYIK